MLILFILLLRYLSGKVDDRIAVLISGFPLLESSKLLGVPIIPNSTGSAQHEAVVMLLEKWGVFRELIALVFDTTSSNTGRFQGAATCIEKTLGHAVLWCACRHHVFKIHIQHVAELICGKRKTPSEAIFKRFQNEFLDLKRETKVKEFNSFCFIVYQQYFEILLGLSCLRF